MPIRFRCAYCNQLLGISRRKAGTVVRCPTCAGQVVVPNAPEQEGDNADEEARPLVFERDNFDELLNGNEEGAVAIPKSDSGFQAAKAPPALSGEASDFTEPVGRLHAVAGVEQPQSVKAEIRDYVLSKRRLMLIGIGVIVWSIVIFAAGIFVGCSLTPGG